MIQPTNELAGVNWFKQLLDFPTSSELREYLSTLNLQDLVILCSSGEVNPWCDEIDDPTYIIDLIVEKVDHLKTTLQQNIQAPIYSFSSLPDELVGEILFQLGESESIGSIRPVSKRFSQIGSNVIKKLPFIIKPGKCPQSTQECLPDQILTFDFPITDEGKLDFSKLSGPIDISEGINRTVWYCSCLPFKIYSHNILPYRLNKEPITLQKNITFKNGKTEFSVKEIVELSLDLYRKPLTKNDIDILFPPDYQIEDNVLTSNIIRGVSYQTPISLLDLILYVKNRSPSAKELRLYLVLQNHEIFSNLAFRKF